MNRYFVCRCFFVKNIFLKQYGIHVEYCNTEDFLTKYEQILRQQGCDSENKLEDVISEIENEIKRRKCLGQQSVERREIISKCYAPLHRGIYTFKEEYLAPEFLKLVDYCRSERSTVDGIRTMEVFVRQRERIYSFPVFQKEFCEKFLEELEHFEASDCPKGRPNTMNNYGILLNELGFDENFMTRFRQEYLSPITSLLFPDWGGDSLDSHKAFIVKYNIGDDLDLSYHYDNAEVTLNVALGKDFDGGELYFGDMRTDRTEDPKYSHYEHRQLYGVLHRGQHLHGALPIEDGERYNLIMWLRSSKVRNENCPMCDEKPSLVEAVGFGDGFTVKDKVVNVCVAF